MNLRRTIARAVALVVLATPAAVTVAGPTSPANAASPTVDTVTTIAISSPRVIAYHDGYKSYIEGSVKDSSGQSVYDGTVTLEALRYGSTAWTAVATANAGGYVSFDVQPDVTTQYRLTYSGWSQNTSTYEKNYRASQSAAPVTQPVARKAVIKYKGLHMWGKVLPAKKMKLKFKVYKHHHYRTWFTVKTTARGKWSKHIRGKVGTRFVVIVPGSDGYVGTADPYHII